MNSKRVFIVSDKQFPHGDAGGNRIEYMAKSFAYEGMQPVVVSLGRNTSTEYDSQHNFYRYGDIIYKNAKVSKSFLSWYLLSGYKVNKILKNFAPKEGAPIVIYSTNPIFVSFIISTFGKRCRIFYDVVEWDDFNSFRLKKFDPHYCMFRWVFYGIFPKGDGIIAISKNIENHFKKLGCRTCLYPICLDAKTLKRDYRLRDNNLLNLIYPGNPENKDDVAKVIKAISKLPKDKQGRLKLHFTSVSKNRIMSLLGKDCQLIDILSDVIVFHPWLEYEELIKLYYSMDALILFRYDNQVCRSNFPSKVPELLSCGIFIIANNVGDFFDYLENGVDSIRIEDNTTEACVSALLYALSLNENEKHILSIHAAENADIKFNYKIFSHKITNFISQ